MIFYENDSTDPYFNLAAEEFFLGNDLGDTPCDEKIFCAKSSANLSSTKATEESGEIGEKTAAEEPILLVWQNSPSVVIGRNQNMAAEVDFRVAESRGIRVARRLTGGGAVYHDFGNLNYSVITEASGYRFDFARFAKPILHAMTALGVCAEFSGRNDLVLKTGDTNGAEVWKKFSGHAQGRIGHRLLHHGTLLFATNLMRLGEVLTPDAAKFRSHSVASVQSRVTNLAEHLPPGTTLDGLKSAVISAMHKSFGGRFFRRTFSSEQVAAIETLRDEKYTTWGWNFGRSPEANFRVEKRFPWGKLSVELKISDGLICEGRFSGDFFAATDPQTLVKGLIGQRFDHATLAATLSDEMIRRTFPDSSRNEWLELLFSV